MNQNNIVSVLLIGIIGVSGFMLYKKITEKKVGDTCKFKEGVDGYIVATIEDEDLKKGLNKITKKCRRCNKTGCASYEIK
jgi:putative component of membrane protein insertase Oxa1/YidC/SpoIIIJ protein YidD